MSHVAGDAPALGAVARKLLNIINNCTADEQLDETAGLLWSSYGNGQLDDLGASYLCACIEARRAPRAPVAVSMPAKLRARISTRFPARRYQASPNRQASRERRRLLGGSGALPSNLRHHYTEGQRSVLCVIAGEVKRQGACDLPIDQIGALAGVCRTTVQDTIRLARRLCHLRVTERPQHSRKHLTNVVEIAIAEWRAWLKRAPSAAREVGFKTTKILCTTKSIDRKKKHAFEVSEPFQGCGPPNRRRERSEMKFSA